MIVKINGSVFDTERVMRFAPHKKGGLDFQPDDVCTLSMMAERQITLKSADSRLGQLTRWVGGLCSGKISSATRCRSASRRSLVNWKCRNGNEKSR